ncbi:hypothetical protein EVAR_83053_1 [Eumeta japonica]|uniref:Uncharacterized protein n=1 Tax=Eumeta variegata TaxID=151549 RepID=A0A4C1VLL3_EUMVA|nr:hypothetical protein EVAR_83053_1 [Eumeta japonica]
METFDSIPADAALTHKLRTDERKLRHHHTKPSVSVASALDTSPNSVSQLALYRDNSLVNEFISSRVPPHDHMTDDTLARSLDE